ncbi:hypothetical protein [Kingella oralis]|uniref:hypothetical protein n=1 Tax=Kingella oralis TaxID=505 RepID=UPI002D80875B|nr:hypothetical protein [Kingella oralis]
MDFPVFRLPLSVFVIVAPHSLIQGGEPQIVQVVQQGEPTLYKAVWSDYISSAGVSPPTTSRGKPLHPAQHQPLPPSFP